MSSKNLIPPREHNDILSAIARQLDITDEQRESAEKRYKSLGDWLERPESSVRQFTPHVHAQGSMLLGTVIRPINDADEFDIDLVCRLECSKRQLSQADLKTLIGEEIKSYNKEHGMATPVEEGKRCWTLQYVDDTSFHMDILPAIPDVIEMSIPSAVKVGYAETLIAITDNTLPNFKQISKDWPLSNPLGYAEWFKSRMAIEISRQKMELLKSDRAYAKVDDIPDHKVKAPLQKVVQLLKRHRDRMYEDDEDKPISIIITTLAAMAYNNESDLASALTNIIGKIGQIPYKYDGKWYIPNPINPEENFADKWEEHPERARKFFEWSNQMREDVMEYVAASSFDKLPVSFVDAFGEGIIRKTAKDMYDLDVSFTNSAVILGGVTQTSPNLNNAVAEAKATGNVSKPWLEA